MESVKTGVEYYSDIEESNIEWLWYPYMLRSELRAA